MNDERYLRRAVELSQESTEPVACGTVITDRNGIIAEAFNSQRTDNIAVYHAEIKALIAANLKLGSRTLSGATAYCSCEPCAMCLTAFSSAKIERIVFHKRMIDLCPDDPQAQLDSQAFVSGLNFVLKLEQLALVDYA